MATALGGEWSVHGGPSRRYASVRTMGRRRCLAKHVKSEKEKRGIDALACVAHRQDDIRTVIMDGLSIVRRLVELHGGTVSAVSPGIGRGVTFTVRFPYQPAASARAQSWMEQQHQTVTPS